MEKTRQMQDRKPKTLLKLEDGVIIAKDFTYLDDAETGLPAGICAKNDDGSESFFTRNRRLTWREVFNISVPDDATYLEKRRAILSATGWDEEECMWLETDDRGNVNPDTDTYETISNWLNSEVDPCKNEFEEAIYHQAFDTKFTEHAPGFQILAELTDDEINQLQFYQSDLGGPASSVPCVKSGATLEELNAMLERKGMPFVFIEDGDGSN